ncbi:IclR family transcriptional regulator [Mameliella alba]|nr:IclR family transcriptional regulator [Antarctobacter heliothermus]MBY6146112.1 IclR family transcriptional regulator [Mameliella alba]MCA0955297.1 IclR family transcriptional regulator [Mameliella alba]
MSSTVAKALSLLEYFSEEEPELGLSELTRRAGINKASVYRLLTSLTDAGLLEQKEGTRAYSLGAGVLRLAQIREATSPIASIVSPALEQLANNLGETAHASIISGPALATIGICESTRSTRVSLIAGEILPLHSTASGVAVLAFGSQALRDRTLASPLKSQTIYTMTDPEEVRESIAIVQRQGYATSEEENEEDVYGIAVPFFDQSGMARGALAVATPCHRMTDSLRQQIVTSLWQEADAVSHAIGGHPSRMFSQAIAQTVERMGAKP